MRKLTEISKIAISGFKRLLLCLLIMLIATAMAAGPLSYHPLLANDQTDDLYYSYWQTLQEYYQLSQALKQSQEGKQQARQAYELARQFEQEKTEATEWKDSGFFSPSHQVGSRLGIASATSAGEQRHRSDE